MQFSSLLNKFDTGVFEKLTAKQRALERAGRPVIDLFVGTPDFACEEHILAAGRNAFIDPENIKYAILDLPEMTEAVIAYYKSRYGVILTPDMIASCSGTQDGMSHAGMCLAGAGDIALLPDPGYIAFETCAIFAGAQPWHYPLKEENGFLPDFKNIPENVLKQAKYLVLSYPSNPSGAAAPKSVYAEAASLANKYGFVILSDNAYSDIIFGTEGFSFLSIEGARNVGGEFFSLSKSFNTTGARIAFFIGNPELVAAFRRLRSQYDFGMFVPLQKMAVAALSGSLDGVKSRCEEYKRRRDAFCSGLNRIGWHVPPPQGTMFVWARIPDGYSDCTEFTEALIEKAGIIAMPGLAFGSEGKRYVRFALVKPSGILTEAVRRIDESGILKQKTPRQQALSGKI